MIGGGHVNSKKIKKTLADVLATAAFLLFILLIAGASGVKRGPGYFLFQSFHLASFYIPVYLLICAYVLLAEKSHKLLAGLNLSLLPFLTFTLLLHVLTGNRSIPVSRVLVLEIGTFVSSLFLLLLLGVEAALIYKLGNILFPHEKWIPETSLGFPQITGKISSLKKRVNCVLSRSSSKEPEPEERKEEPISVQREVFPFPDLPNPPEPVKDVDDSEIQSLISSVLNPGSTVSEKAAFDPVPLVKKTEEKRSFNPEKTLSIDDVMENEGPSRTFDPVQVSDPGIDFLLDPAGDKPAAEMPEPEAVYEAPVPPEIPTPPVSREDLSGLSGTMDSDKFDEPVPDADYLDRPEQPDETGPVESITPFNESDPEELDDPVSSAGNEEPDFEEELSDPGDDEYENAGYISDRMDELDSWRIPAFREDEPDDPDEPAALEELDAAEDEDADPSLSIEAKLSPEGETEKMGVAPKGLPPRHRRWQKYQVPVAGLLKEYPDEGFDQIDDDTRRSARALEETLLEFKIDAKVTGISKGPVITMFEIQPAPGVKVSRIVNLQDNLALRLASSRIRIVAPIPGKQAIGIEVPNKKRSIVSFSQLASSDDYKEGNFEIPVILGKDISGGNQVIDLARTPHLLIAGSTGSGKSVCVNSLICSILFDKSPRDVKLMMVDPKIVELKLYNDIPHLLTPVITEPKRAFQAVQWCLYEMERRYSLLDAMGVRDIKSYNKRIRERDIATTKLPYIVLVIDEFADLMATSGKELEAIVARLAAMSRAVGIHLVLATQRPSIDVITGLIKANFPSRIAFMVASKTDSRIIIDMMGAEKLLGKGDMLFTSAWDPFPSRMQGSFLSEDEVERVVSYVKTLGDPEYIDDEIFLDDEDEYSDDRGGESSFSDPLYNKSLEIVMQAGKASASYLQRRLKIGYNRAARLVEEMEIRGIVGPQNGSKPREVIHIPDNPGSRVLNGEE